MRTRRSADEGRALVEQFKSSGLGQREFASKHGVPLPPGFLLESCREGTGKERLLLAGLTERIAVRLGSIATRRIHGDERVTPDDDAAMFAAAAESLRLPGIRPREDEADSHRLCASVDGFTLHAGRHVEAEDREALERLLRYCLRPPFSADRFSLDDHGRVHYRLRKPWPGQNGSTDLVLEPLALLRRLASLVPRPYSNLVRYHGLFSNRVKHRPLLPRPDAPDTVAPAPDSDPASPASGPGLPAETPGAPGDAPPRRHHLAWAKLLRRVLDIDALSCAKCSTRRYEYLLWWDGLSFHWL